jgi:hypothetical protein
MFAGGRKLDGVSGPPDLRSGRLSAGVQNHLDAAVPLPAFGIVGTVGPLVLGHRVAFAETSNVEMVDRQSAGRERGADRIRAAFAEMRKKYGLPNLEPTEFGWTPSNYLRSA